MKDEENKEEKKKREWEREAQEKKEGTGKVKENIGEEKKK